MRNRKHAIQSTGEFVKSTFSSAQLDANIIETTRLIAFECVEIVSARISLNLSLDGFRCLFLVVVVVVFSLCRQLWHCNCVFDTAYSHLHSVHCSNLVSDAFSLWFTCFALIWRANDVFASIIILVRGEFVQFSALASKFVSQENMNWWWNNFSS